jgi:hypothetical protein
MSRTTVRLDNPSRRIQRTPGSGRRPSPIHDKNQHHRWCSRRFRGRGKPTVESHRSSQTPRLSLQLLRRLMPREHMLLELLHIIIPELGSLAIKRTRAIVTLVYTLTALPLMIAHLFGSPSKLCKDTSNPSIPTSALHVFPRISKQMRPEKSTFG